MRAVAMHEHLGRQVRLIRQIGGNARPVCEIATEDGFLRVRPAREEK